MKINELNLKSNRFTKNSNSIKIYGDIMHLDSEDLKVKYYNMKLEDFLAYESRYSIGNYVIVIREKKKTILITSTAYSGGYIYLGSDYKLISTLLSPLLSNIMSPIEIDSFGLSTYIGYAPKSNFNLLPFTTMFKDVLRIPPGTYLELERGELNHFYSYLTLENKNTVDSFATAMEELTLSFKTYFSKHKKKVALMFSGGVDSLAIYLALREAIGSEKIRLFTMEYTDTNGPKRAIAVAKSLGVDIELISDDIYQDGLVYDKVSEFMKYDILTTKAPHLALLNVDLDNTIVFHGQNMDAIANISMTILQEVQEVAYLSAPAKRIAHTENRATRQLNAFLKNIQFTDAYLEDDYFQRITVEFYQDFYKNIVADPNPSFDGILRGLISSQVPNMLSPSDYSLDQKEYLNKEILKFKSYIGAENINKRLQVDMMRYLTYIQLANKNATSFDLSKNTRLLFASMSGPILSYFLGQKRNLTHAIQPKKEIYAYARKISKKPYRTHIKYNIHDDPRVFPRVAEKSLPYSILKREYSLLDPKASLVLKSISDKETFIFSSKLYNKLYKGTDLSIDEKNLALKLINLEKIMIESNKGKV